MTSLALFSLIPKQFNSKQAYQSAIKPTSESNSVNGSVLPDKHHTLMTDLQKQKCRNPIGVIM
jgi:hypothetical protein